IALHRHARRHRLQGDDAQRRDDADDLVAVHNGQRVDADLAEDLDRIAKGRAGGDRHRRGSHEVFERQHRCLHQKIRTVKYFFGFAWMSATNARSETMSESVRRYIEGSFTSKPSEP